VATAAPAAGGTSAATGASQATDVEARLRELDRLPEKERQERLVAGAREEKVVNWYDTYNLEAAQRLIKGFNEEYPFLEVRYARGSGGDITQKYLAEERAGRHQADVYNGGGNNQFEAIEAGVLAPYDSPAKRQIPDAYKNPLWTARVLSVTAWAVNTEVAPPGPRPARWADLLDPSLRGRLAMDDQPGPDVNMLMIEWGTPETETYLERLMQQRPLVFHGRNVVLDQVVSGAVPYAINIGLVDFRQQKNKGAPLEVILPTPFAATTSPQSISKNAPHPHAAALLYDFIIGPRGQAIIADQGDVPVLPTVPVKYPEQGEATRSNQARAITPDKLGAMTYEAHQIIRKYIVPR
jgi:iron(III) transport system substrate-binding protein